ncbi:MAG: hypothetical protein C4K48_11590 [Candidatus Thorarchaeota archaeon]|nr:MAG: hypothetical protein C4K48_11590 [Candidatus Thorarchaeota archaeon]
MSVDTDVIIIGAGPAGLIAAATLSELGVQYTLFDRDEKPGEKKPCGGFIPNRAVKEFDVEHIRSQHEIVSLRMKFPGLDVVRVDFGDVVGVNVRREDLADCLIRRIDKKHGNIRLGTKISNVKISESGCSVSLLYGSNLETLTSQLIIDGSGVNPVTQRFIPLRERPSNSHLGYAIQYHLKRDTEFQKVNDFYYGHEYSPRGYAWVFPCGKISVVGSGGLIDRVRENNARIDDYLRHLISEVEPTRTDLEGAELIRREAALMPLAGIIRPSYGRRILLAGDAACQCSPLSGEGIFYSMVGGREAAKTAATCIKKNDFSDDALSQYEKAWIDSMGSDLRWGLYLQKKFTDSGSKSIGSGFLRSRQTSRIIAEMLVGKRSVRNAILKAAPGYLKSKFV